MKIRKKTRNCWNSSNKTEKNWKNEEAKKKGEQLLAKLAPLQGKLGIFGVGVGVWCIVAHFLFYV